MKDYLNNFDTKFSKDVDSLLNKYDKTSTGLFGKDETKSFLDELALYITEYKAVIYKANQDDFDQVFRDVDQEKTGYICKPEMAKMIKFLFSSKNEWKPDDSLLM